MKKHNTFPAEIPSEVVRHELEIEKRENIAAFQAFAEQAKNPKEPKRRQAHEPVVVDGKKVVGVLKSDKKIVTSVHTLNMQIERLMEETGKDYLTCFEMLREKNPKLVERAYSEMQGVIRAERNDYVILQDER